MWRKKLYLCLICGYNQLPDPLYRKDGIPDISPICPYCAFQPGYDDEELGLTIKEYRENWLREGATWFDPKKKPKQWDLKQQLTSINVTVKE